MPMRVLALDFDGVISDSAPESFIVALRTYTRLRPGSGLVAVASELEHADVVEVREHPLYRGFVGLMPLGNRAEDFGVVLSLLESGLQAGDQRAYDTYRRAQPAAFAEVFHERFYEERRRFSDMDRAGWLDLLGPYSEFIELLRRRADHVILALATAKDRRTVGRLLNAYGVADLFSNDRILDKETGVSKRAHMTVLHERLGVAFADITFVDDKVNHLESVADLGVRCALAAWGYNGVRERTIADSRGYLVCGLADAESLLFSDV
jgi:phosphoglycolate phosphatase-like HAD superfamily hydrolase